MVRFLTFEQYHGKKGVGSTRLRVHNLIKYWPEADLYKYGENPDVLVFQKVYCAADYKFPKNFPNIKILDICDPDWLDMQGVKETVDAVDGVTCPTEALAEFLRQLTDKPIKVIPDRHEIPNIKSRRIHTGKVRKAVWFGYKQNAELLQWAVPSLEKRGVHLTVISNDDPQAQRWGQDYEKLYTFKKYSQDTILHDLAINDVCILPQGNRPQDRFKSNNKTTLAWLSGTPVVTTAEELDALMDSSNRNMEAEARQEQARDEYNVQLSVKDMKEFINELKEIRISTRG